MGGPRVGGVLTEDLDEKAVPSASLVAEIARLYGLPEPAGWQDLGGSWTTNLLLDVPGPQVVARVHQGPTSAARLLAEQAVRVAVADAGIPAVRPLPSLTGETAVRLASGRMAELEPFVEADQRMKTAPLFVAGFGILARLHEVLRMAELPVAARTVTHANHLPHADALARTRLGAERMRSWGRPDLRAYADAVEAHVEAVVAAEAGLQAGQVTQLVHGDFWDNNVLFRNGELAVLLDFEFMAERTRIDDLALPLYFYCLEPGRGLPGAAERAEFRTFIDAYDAAATMPLTADERAALPLAIARQPAWSVGRWIVELPTDDAIKHAESAMNELPVAQAMLSELVEWQTALLV